ncbi:MAG TPA: CDP-diacylglycerol--glycerol-3-phosphate 3-phosphatidyltransferase [Elusimicrobiota bacterium]|nr:CDP-diacylglycerol--glycerol-3-phosphate 3-phosphatidyltransferase [Elusimicrobiota bacterium]
MTLANRLTLARLILVPAFMLFMFYDCLATRVASLVIFIGASITDWYDGEIARRTGTVTVIGTFLDPLVDKMLIAAALIGFVELRELQIPAWMVVLVISREFLITGLRSLAASRGVVMAADQAGKFKMASQITAIITILVILSVDASLDKWSGWRPEMIGGWQHALHLVLIQAPYYLVLIVTIITVVSGYLYIQKYRELLRSEFSVLKSRNPVRSQF